MDKKTRMAFLEALQVQWECFRLAAHVPGDERLIMLYIDAKDKTHELLSQLAKED